MHTYTENLVLLRFKHPLAILTFLILWSQKQRQALVSFLGKWGSIPGRGRNFYFVYTTQISSGVQEASNPMSTGSSIPKGKTMIKNPWSYHYTCISTPPHIIMVTCLINRRNNTFYLQWQNRNNLPLPQWCFTDCISVLQ